VHKSSQGEIRTPSQYVVNDYLSKWKVTVKDFRTYHASRLVFNYLKEMHKKGKTEEQRKADVKEAVEKAAEHLGHLPATCKRAYVDPRILELYMAGKFKANETLLEKALAAETINETAETSTYEFEDFERLFDAWGPDILEKSNPGFLEKLKKYFRKKYEYKPDGKTLNENQMDRIQAILEKYKIDPIKWAEGMAVRAYALGKLLGQRSDLAKVVVNSLPFKLETVKEPFVVRDTAGREFPMLPLQSQEQEAIKWSMENAASYIQTTNTSLIAGIRRLVTQAKMERWTANELSQALFDKFGEFNRDWRRIAITELSYAENNGYLSTLKPGDKLIINEAVDCCKHCKRLNVGKVFTLTDGPGEDPMTTVWVGKNNVGKKVADWRPAAPLHPNARCRYTRFNDTFYKMDESGKLVLRTAEEILQRDRQHS
jgi:predicted glycoside hydrolase/deacetylase ChbG (UPF0249 family)